MKQQYEQYTPEDQQVWRIMYDRQIDQIYEYASTAYINGLRLCNFTNERIPVIDEVNEILLKATGWKIEIVAGLIDNHLFFKLLSEKKFPASTWLRKMESLDYLEEPDMFHDILGHVPLLTNHDFCNFLEGLAETALQFIDDDNSIELISRIYWYSVEFGLIMESDILKIYGAGILSSRAETHYSLHAHQPRRVNFDIPLILETPYIKDKFQEIYFIIDSYKNLFESIDQLPELLTQKMELNSQL